MKALYVMILVYGFISYMVGMVTGMAIYKNKIKTSQSEDKEKGVENERKNL